METEVKTITINGVEYVGIEDMKSLKNLGG